MTEEQIALAKRAVACKGWRWMPGMAFLDGGESWRVASALHADTLHADRLPNLQDPATLGCLLALVREAWGNKVVIRIGNGWWDVETDDDEWGSDIIGRSVLHGLVAALEAAP